jgi:mycofactocin system transcriptional regulator
MASSAEKEGRSLMSREPASRVGRRRSTTGDHITSVALELFASRGFDDVSVDDVARAAGIARRTLFRYYPSKNAIPWGDFDAHLDHMRELLQAVPADAPTTVALRSALLAFNSFDEAETARHRQRMRVILETDALQAHSMTMYAGWRTVIADFVAHRLGLKVTDLIPQTTAWSMLGVALSAYGHWLADESVSLQRSLGDAFDTVNAGLAELDRRTAGVPRIARDLR